jgi:hypothetical protein
VAADRDVERHLAYADPDLRLEPLPRVRDQIDNRDRGIEQVRREPATSSNELSRGVSSTS